MENQPMSPDEELANIEAWLMSKRIITWGEVFDISMSEGPTPAANWFQEQLKSFWQFLWYGTQENV